MAEPFRKYEHSRTLGTITSASSNVVWVPDEHVSLKGRTAGAGKAIVGGNEEVLCWDVKKSELLSRWRDSNCTAKVTAIAQSTADPDVCAVGYSDGSIRIWDSRLASVIISFNGHKSSVTSLAFDHSGVRLASGSQDTDLIVWDLVAEVGLFKLRGHKNQITSVNFLEPRDEQHNENTISGMGASNGYTNGVSRTSGYLLSSGKDALIKVWDLDSRHCIETHVVQSDGECWSVAVSPTKNSCVTAGNEGELKVWSIDIKALFSATNGTSENSEQSFLHEQGVLRRYGSDKTLNVSFSPVGGYIAAHGSDKAVEIWRIRSEAELQKHLARKRKRRREKLTGKEKSEQINGDVGTQEDEMTVEISDAIVQYVILRTAGKVKSFDWSSIISGKLLQLLVSTTNNLLEMYDITSRTKERESKSNEPPDYTRAFAVEIPGHRTDIRSIALSSDDAMLATASNGGLKIWNVRTQNCIRSLECGYALCSAFLPGDRIVILGNRNGELELFDVASSSRIDKVKAHDGSIWALHVHPDGKSVVTGSADKSAKFWSFEIVQEEILGTKSTAPRLKLVHRRTLKVSDDIQSLKFSPDARLLAVALFDSTVKVFFVDTLKLFLNLYGHKLPVLDMDISYDSKLIVTCSADKNVRIWGLDFGDCHKALFAHQDSVMQVAFVPHNHEGNGYHFFSAGKDRMIKYWDGDKFEQIQRLPGHHGEIWAMAVSRTGDFLASASHDKSIRVWQQTDEQIFLEEEREKELEELYENTLTTSVEQEEGVGEEKNEVAPAGKQTTETLMAGERIAEALDLGMEDLEQAAAWEKQKATQPGLPAPQRNVIFLAYGNISAEQHVLNVVEKIKAASLQDALLVLTFDKTTTLFVFLKMWAERQWNIPLVCRILFFMLKTHHRQIVASKTMQPMLDGIRSSLRAALQTQKDEIGLNMAALKFLTGQVEEKGKNDFVDEELWKDGELKGKGGKKRAFVNVA